MTFLLLPFITSSVYDMFPEGLRLPSILRIFCVDRGREKTLFWFSGDGFLRFPLPLTLISSNTSRSVINRPKCKQYCGFTQPRKSRRDKVEVAQSRTAKISVEAGRCVRRQLQASAHDFQLFDRAIDRAIERASKRDAKSERWTQWSEKLSESQRERASEKEWKRGNTNNVYAYLNAQS
jgi:hypothetical protein